ncbi:hypothetical protein D3C87_779760 [compost metagenome]
MAPDPFSPPVLIERTGSVWTSVLNRQEAGNEVSAAMFDAMGAALRNEVEQPA